jgi:hypothetical protein
MIPQEGKRKGVVAYLTLSLSFGVLYFLTHTFLQVVSSIFDLWVCTKYKCHICHILGKRGVSCKKMSSIVFSMHFLPIIMIIQPFMGRERRQDPMSWGCFSLVFMVFMIVMERFSHVFVASKSP